MSPVSGHHRTDTASFSFEIEKPKYHRDIGACGNVVKAGFPFFDHFSCPGRRDRQDKPIHLNKFVDHLFHNIVGAVAVYGYAPQPFEKTVEGFFKKDLLAHPV